MSSIKLPKVKPMVLRRLPASKSQRRPCSAAAATNRPRIPHDTREFVWNRDGGCCQNCSSRDNLQFDHVIPLALGGSNTAENIELLCRKCNQAKSAKLTAPPMREVVRE